jgi:hypothetical protein
VIHLQHLIGVGCLGKRSRDAEFRAVMLFVARTDFETPNPGLGVAPFLSNAPPKRDCYQPLLATGWQLAAVFTADFG